MHTLSIPVHSKELISSQSIGTIALLIWILRVDEKPCGSAGFGETGSPLFSYEDKEF